MSPTKFKGTGVPLAKTGLPLAIERALAPLIGRTTATDDPLSSSRSPSKESFERASADARKRADDLYRADEQVKAARREHETHYAMEVTKLENVGRQVLDRFNKLEEEKVAAVASNGDEDVSDDDIIEINAGGKIISTQRGTLTRWEGMRLEALFSGRWEKMLLRDGDGRIFLDVDGDCFQAIVVYLNEVASSTEGSYPEPPSVYEELEAVLAHQLELFHVPLPRMLDSNIIKDSTHANVIYNWLEQDGSDGSLIVLIETTEGGVLGGYTNSSWRQAGGYYGTKADKAFLFTLTGFDLDFPQKMKLKDPDDACAIKTRNNYGPIFGSEPDLCVDETRLFVKTGYSYERSPAQLKNAYTIQEMEVFSIKGIAPPALGVRKDTKRPSYSPTINKFTNAVNHVLIKKWEALYAFDAEVTHLEEMYKDEKHFIESLAIGSTKNVVTLNVCGTMVATRRATLMVAEDSVLAQQFDDSKWTIQGSFPPVKSWTPDEVTSWVNDIKGISEDVGSLFRENAIIGSELLSLDKEGLKMLGVERVGTLCLLSDKISLLKKAANESKVTHIEHSPYCFCKILEYLRLKQLNSVNLAGVPAPPSVRNSQKKSFEKVVDYYFPGDSSKYILG